MVLRGQLAAEGAPRGFIAIVLQGGIAAEAYGEAYGEASTEAGLAGV